MKGFNCSVCCVSLATMLLAGVSQGGDISLVPINADGSHSVSGNEIILDGGGQRVWIELSVSGWSPEIMRSFQAKIDPTGYSSGAAGTIGPALEACTTHADCTAALGNLSLCSQPPGSPTHCEAGFIDTDRSDWVFAGITAIAAVDISSLEFNFGGTILFPPFLTDPGVAKYGGTLVLDIPVGAVGTFTIALNPVDSFQKDGDGNAILPLTLGSVQVTVLCASNADCNDASACTADVCLGDGTCSNTPNYNTAVDCCNPNTGGLTQIDDGNECTDDVCDSDTGIVSHPPVPSGTTCGNPAGDACDAQDLCNFSGVCVDRSAPSGTACGDPSNTDCTDPDTCDGGGTCQDNHAGAGAACGDLSDTDCTNPDTCDGGGACLSNHESLGTLCGDQTSTDCDNPDSCNNSGTCLDNLEPNGTTCDDGLFCNVAETCQVGACSGGNARDCGDGLGCTTDTCDEVLDQCNNDLDAGFCLILGVCFGEGALNPANDCEECNTAIQTTNWSFVSSGTACGSPGDTDCDNPDTCSGAGVCDNNNEPLDTVCGDSSATDCTDPDTCNASGVCLDNHHPDGSACTDDGNECKKDECNAGVCEHLNWPAGTACGDPTDTDCDNPDTCDGGGSCLDNLEGPGTTCTGDGNDCTEDVCSVAGTCTHPDEASGTPCGSNSNTDCDNPDTCNGTGTCLINNEPDGFSCTDDGNDCTNDICSTGTCDHPNHPGGFFCGNTSDTDCTNPDTCDGSGACLDNHEVTGTLCGDPSDTVCDNPDTCNGGGDCLNNFEPNLTDCNDTLFCNGTDLCDLGVCAHSGSPCGGPCDEEFDICLCEAPLVEALGNRYLRITPQPPGSGPQGILITPDCAGAVGKYLTSPFPVDMDGDGADDNVAPLCFPAVPGGTCTGPFLTPAEWGNVYAFGEDIVPGTAYVVQGDCGSPGNPGLSDSTIATTGLFGDLGDGYDPNTGLWIPPNSVVDFDDIAGVVDAFKNIPGAPGLFLSDLAGANTTPCLVSQFIDFADIAADVDAFKGLSYETSMSCPVPCP